MSGTTKASQIMALHAEGKSTREIARRVFATDSPTESNLAYVRVVVGQRRGGGQSANDKAYQRTEAYRRWNNGYWRARYAADAAYRETVRKRNARAWVKRKQRLECAAESP